MASQLLGIKTRFTNDLGSPLVGGQVYTYFAGTSTNQDSYSDAALTVPNTNPVILDDTGSADIFLKGSYRIRVFDKSGRFIEEQDNVTQAASQGDATELTNKVNAVESGLYTANTEIDKVKLDTGITVTAKNGGVIRTQAEKNADATYVADFGAIGVGDETSKIQAAIDANDVVSLGDKDIVYTVSHLVLHSNTELTGVATLDFSSNPTYSNDINNPLLLAKGTAGDTILVTVDVVKDARVLSVSSTSGLMAGDIVEIATPLHAGDFDDLSTRVGNGELVKIESILSSTQIRLAEPIADTFGYATANGAQIRKINTINKVKIGSGIKIKGKGRPASGDGDLGLVIIYGKDCIVKSNFTGVDYNAVKLESCYNTNVSEGIYTTDIKGTNNSLNYGVVSSGSSKHTKVFNNSFSDMRHATLSSHVSTLGANKFYGVSRFISVFNNNFYNTWHAAVCTHNDADQVDVYNNNFYGCNVGVNPRERNMRIVNNIFVDSGTGIYLSSHPRDILIEGNTCVSQNGGNFIYGKFDLNSEVSGIEILNNKINSMVGASAIYILNDTGVTNKGLRIKGNRIKNATGSGGSSAMIRVNGQPIVDAEISDNRVVGYSNAIGLKIESGGDNILIKGNHVEYGAGGTAYSTAAGTYTKTYAVNNSAKGTGGNIWSGSAALANAATLNQQNTWY